MDTGNIKPHNIILTILKRIAGVLGGIFVFIVISRGLNYIYVDTEEWQRIVLHDFYENKGKIDNVYLGSSHVHYDINPLILDEMNGKFNFNLSTSSQNLNASYYLLREADRYNSLSHVYLELYYYCSVYDNFASPDFADPLDLCNYKDYRCIDNMKNSFNKIEYIYKCFETDRYVDVCFPFVRYRSQLGDWDYVKRIMAKKSREEYLMYEGGNDYGELGYIQYGHRGYCYSTVEYKDEQRLFSQNRILSVNPMSEKSEDYLKKIICYCQERDIPVILFVSPMDELRLISTENYDNFVKQVSGIAADYGVEFYDFNLVKEEYLPIQKGEYFLDAGHLNNKGADMFTRFFHETVSRSMAENEQYFYDSYAEKLSNSSPRIYGLYYRESDNDCNFNIYHIASNRIEGMEYSVIIESDSGEKYTLQDFSENKEFTLPVEEHGNCTVKARMKNTLDDVQTLVIQY
ncbi:MAG: hypothetical protein NC313_15850 [Butyrivibrio sp.]|nr:hypothetical protein [Butyrivibrio sp.]